MCHFHDWPQHPLILYWQCLTVTKVICGPNCELLHVHACSRSKSDEIWFWAISGIDKALYFTNETK